MVLVALTGYGREEDHRRSLAAGFDHHLVKPIPTEAILAILDATKPSTTSSRSPEPPNGR